MLKFTCGKVAYIITIIYILSTFGFVLNVSSQNEQLMQYYPSDPKLTSALPVIAAKLISKAILPDVVNALLLYCAISAANAALYVASRAFHGLGKSLRGSWGSNLGRVDSKGVPVRALVLSLSLAWLPFLSLTNKPWSTNLLQVAVSLGSTSGVLVWSALCLTVYKYCTLNERHRRNFGPGHAKYDRFNIEHRPNLLWRLQPYLAGVGGIMSLAVVLVFAGLGLASPANKVLVAMNVYLGPGVFLLFFAVLKLCRPRRRKDLSDLDVFKNELDYLGDLVDPLSRQEAVELDSRHEASGELQLAPNPQGAQNDDQLETQPTASEPSNSPASSPRLQDPAEGSSSAVRPDHQHAPEGSPRSRRKQRNTWA